MIVKKFSFLVILCIASAAVFGEKLYRQSLSPLLGSHFGEVLLVEGTFVDKSNTYFEQNVIEEPYMLRITSVDGKKLSVPVMMEYRVDGSLRIEKDRIYTLKAYETVYEFGIPGGWKDGPVQFSYEIHHRIVVKPVR